MAEAVDKVRDWAREHILVSLLIVAAAAAAGTWAATAGTGRGGPADPAIGLNTRAAMRTVTEGGFAALDGDVDGMGRAILGAYAVLDTELDPELRPRLRRFASSLRRLREGVRDGSEDTETASAELGRVVREIRDMTDSLRNRYPRAFK